MPRKKNPATESGQEFAITCPACASSVSGDGRTLFQKSLRLSDAEAALATLQEIETRFETLANQLTAKDTAMIEFQKKTARENEELSKKLRFFELQLKAATDAEHEAKRMLESEKRKNVGNEKREQRSETARDVRGDAGDEW